MLGRFLVMCMFCGVAAAQQPPVDISVPGQCGADAPVTRINNISEPHRSLLWKNTRVVGGGYFETTVETGYLGLVEHMLALPATKSKQLSGIKRDSMTNSIATFQESPLRTTEFYGDGTSKVMLTRWQFVADGARLCLFDEFMNAQVRDAGATLSLAKSSAADDRRALWKLTWIAGDTVQYELYVEDQLTVDGMPARRAADVLDLAVKLSPKWD